MIYDLTGRVLETWQKCKGNAALLAVLISIWCCTRVWFHVDGGQLCTKMSQLLSLHLGCTLDRKSWYLLSPEKAWRMSRELIYGWDWKGENSVIEWKNIYLLDMPIIRFEWIWFKFLHCLCPLNSCLFDFWPMFSYYWHPHLLVFCSPWASLFLRALWAAGFLPSKTALEMLLLSGPACLCGGEGSWTELSASNQK